MSGPVWPAETPALVVAAAGVVAAHESRACEQCGPDGCERLTEARRVLAARRVELRRSL